MIFRTRDLLVRQRTQLVNALRGHLAEYGVVAAQGIVNVKRLETAVEANDATFPPVVRDVAQMYLDHIAQCSAKIADLERSIRAGASGSETARRLQTMPGIGPIAAMAIDAFAPPMTEFHKGCDFAAWLGLVPRQMSTGGKQKLGRTSKMGQRDIRRLLIIGAMGVVGWAVRKGAPKDSWLARMLTRKPRLVVAIALANKMARSIWAMLRKKEDYRQPVAAAV
jgi:transposase